MSSSNPGCQAVCFIHVPGGNVKAAFHDREDERYRSDRRRRPHAKSRNGCDPCKRRRVKCDERQPICGNCIKKGEKCAFGSISKSFQHKGTPLQRLLVSSNLESSSTDVNALHLKLLDHFRVATAETLIFGSEIWLEKVLPISLQYDFLMQAILLISATHLSFLRPADDLYRKASMLHLSNTLHLYRHALSHPVTSSNADALMSTAMLLSHHAWADISWICVSPETIYEGVSLAPNVPALDKCVDFSLDPLLALAPGLREIFMVSWPLVTANRSIFTSDAYYKSRYSMFHAAHQTDNDPKKFEDFLMTRWSSNKPPQDLGSHLSSTQPPIDEMLMKAKDENDDGGKEASLDAYRNASYHLSPLLSLSRYYSWTTRPYSSSDREILHAVIPDASRQIFSFHVLTNNIMVSMIQRHDKAALLLLLLCYRSARILLPTQMWWWCHARATKMEALLEQMLWRSKLESSDCLEGF